MRFVSRSQIEFLADIEESCRRIIEYTHGLDRDRLFSDHLRFDGVLHNLHVIGEAVKRLPDGLRQLVAVLAHGESGPLNGASEAAIAVHNISEDRLRYHYRGLGNGCVLTLGGRHRGAAQGLVFPGLIYHSFRLDSAGVCNDNPARTRAGRPARRFGFL